MLALSPLCGLVNRQANPTRIALIDGWADTCRRHKRALLCEMSARFCCRYEACALPWKMV
jgi:hypothetical protein